MRTLLRTSLAFGLALLLTQATLSQAYYFAEDELSSLESTPGVSIVYSKAIGPVAGRQSEAESEGVKGEEATTTTVAPTTTAETTIIAEQATTTQTPTTITADAIDASSTTTKVASSSESSATSSTTTASPLTGPASVEANVALPFGVRASASASASASDGSNGVNRLWHYNSQGLNTNTVWFSPSSRSASGSSSLDTEAVESSQSAVRVPAAAATSPAAAPTAAASTSATVSSSSAPVFFRRQPIVSDANDDLDSSNTLTKRIGTNQPTERVSFGEYRARDSERNLYYPDIARIQANGVAVDASRSSSASASSASASASSSSTSSSSSFGVKGGSGFASGQNHQNVWRQTERLTSPSKSVRKVIKTGAQVLSEEKTTFQREPVRVRVVVQKPSAHQAYGGFKVDVQNNYLERLQAASKTNAQQQQQASAASSAAASASSSQSFFTTADKSTKTASKFNQYAAKASESSDKEYVQVSSKIVQTQGVKSPPRPVAVKSLPPPPAPTTPRPPTKTAVKSPVRKPVFEQQTYERYEQEQPEPEPYSFNWQYGDETGNGQFRREEQDANGVVRGSYGYTDAWGLYRIVDYVADAGGYRASIRSNEPGLVERSPTTGQVPEPAHIKVSAGETPSAVVELMRLTKPKPAYQ